MCVALLMLPSRKAVKDAEQAAASAAMSAASSSASAAAEAATSVAPETGATAASAATEPATAASQTAESSSTEAVATPANPALPTPLDLREAAAATAASIAAAQQAALDKAAGKDDGKSSPEASDSAASEPQPDIRPQLVKPIPRKNARPMLADAPAPGSETSASKADDKSSPAKPADPVADLMNGPKPSPVTAGRITSRDGERPSLHSAVEPPAGTSGGSDKRGGAREDVASGNPTSNSSSSSRANSGRSSNNNKAAVVALVGPVSANKAEAEATLERMKVAISANKGGATQAQVFQTPEGWRPRRLAIRQPRRSAADQRHPDRARAADAGRGFLSLVGLAASSDQVEAHLQGRAEAHGLVTQELEAAAAVKALGMPIAQDPQGARTSNPGHTTAMVEQGTTDATPPG